MLTFGAAQERIAIIVRTTSTIAGHFAMFQTVTAASPAPRTSPACSASGPVNATATATEASMTSRTSVVTIRIGSVFQIGRPSWTS